MNCQFDPLGFIKGSYSFKEIIEAQKMPLEQKIDISVAVLREAAKLSTHNIALAFSGGKDSEVVSDIIERFIPELHERIFCIFGNTGVEFPESLKFARKYGQAHYGDRFYETKTRLHKIWESMIARCEYEKHPYYADYGGRGITVCDEWHSYIEFRDWAITHGYNDDLTIDRIKNEKGYDASNCRWATMREQQNNKRSNHIVYLGEIGHTISEWSEILGIGKTTIRMRLESGWSDENALTVPVRKRTRGYRPSASCGAKMDGGEADA